MKVVSLNAIASLYEKAEELSHQPGEGWKCIYFKIPRDEERQAYSLPHFDAGIITHMLAKTKGCLYLCDNGEIFILYKGTHASVQTRLSMYLWALYPEPMNVRTNHHLYSLFDLSKQRAAFHAFCEKRYIEALAVSEARAIAHRASAALSSPRVVAEQYIAG
jgi:hypothetical protein